MDVISYTTGKVRAGVSNYISLLYIQLLWKIFATSNNIDKRPVINDLNNVLLINDESNTGDEISTLSLILLGKMDSRID